MSNLLEVNRPGKFSGWAEASGDRLAHYYHQGGGLLVYSLCNKSAAASMVTKSHKQRCRRCSASKYLPTGSTEPKA